MADKSKLQKVLEEAGKFVSKRKGEWDHAAWEEFIEQVAALGYAKDFETCRNLGNILEGAKYLYLHAPRPKRKPSAKRKAVAKRKPKPRTPPKPKEKA